MILRFPWMLLLLLLIPLLVYLRYARRRQVSIQFSDGAVLAQLGSSWALWVHHLLPWVYVLGLVGLILALARPQRGLEESKVHTETVDIVLLVDVSTSMRAMDFATSLKTRNNRLDAAKEVIQRFIKSRKEDRMGIVAFAALPYTVAPLTLDHGWLVQQLERIKTGMLEDGTAIGSAIASATNRLRDSEAISKVIILLTDGVNNAGSLTPENAAQAAKALGIKIYTVGAGAEGLVPYPVQDPFGGQHIVRKQSMIDTTSLKNIAEITGAQFFRATDFEGLDEIYDAIDEMEKTEIEVEQFTRFEEEFQPLLAAALLLLALEKFLSLSRFGRLP